MWDFTSQHVNINNVYDCNECFFMSGVQKNDCKCKYAVSPLKHVSEELISTVKCIHVMRGSCQVQRRKDVDHISCRNIVCLKNVSPPHFHDLIFLRCKHWLLFLTLLNTKWKECKWSRGYCYCTSFQSFNGC